MPNLAGSIQARYDKAEREFFALAGVDTDHSRLGTVADLVYIAQFELDLAETGEGDLTPKDLAKIRRFVNKWGAK